MSDKKSKEEKSAKEVEEVSEALEKISHEEPEMVSQFMAMARMGAAPNPLHEKLSEKHIDKMVDLAVDHDKNQFQLYKQGQENDFNDQTSSRRYTFAYFIFILIAFFGIILVFKEQPSILIPCLTGFGGLIGGFLAGIGFGKSK